jgi:hypothetical protein
LECGTQHSAFESNEADGFSKQRLFSKLRSALCDWVSGERKKPEGIEREAGETDFQAIVSN